MKKLLSVVAALLLLFPVHAANRIKTVVAGETILAADWNNEFNNIYDGTIDRTAGRWGTNDDIPLTLGSAQDTYIEWNTDQTVDHTIVGLGSGLIFSIMEQGDMGTDWGIASQTNPALYVHSADASATTDWIKLTHDQTNAVIDVGSGSLTFTDDVILQGTTPLLTVGDGGAEDTAIVYDGNAQDFYAGLDDTDDAFKIGLGSTVGTNPAITVAGDGSEDVTLSGRVIAGADVDYYFARFNSAFTSGGATTSAAKLAVDNTLTGASGDTAYLTGLLGNVAITTQGATETITVVSQLRVEEPQITVGSGDTVTHSASIYVVGAATEATNDYAVFVDSGSVRLDGQFVTGGNNIVDNIQASVAGSFTSGGSGTSGHMMVVAGDLTGATGDTSKLNLMEVGSAVGGSVTTQGATETVSIVSTLHLTEPDITVGSGDTVTSGATFYIASAPTEGTNNYAFWVSDGDIRFGDGDGGNDSYGFGAAPVDYVGSYFGGSGTYTSGGSSTLAAGVGIGYDIIGASGDTGRLTLLEVGAGLGSTIVTQGAGDTIGMVSSVYLREPVITDSGDTITGAATLYIQDAPTEGGVNYALYVDSGTTRLDGDLTVGGAELDYVKNLFSGTFTSGGASTVASGFRIRTDITAANGDTDRHALAEIGGGIGASITTQSNSETVGDVATLYLTEPDITIGTDTITDAATLHIQDAPTEGSSNFALRVDAGDVQFDDATLNIGGLSYEWPAGGQAAGEQLQTDGAGTLTWESAASAAIHKDLLPSFVAPSDALRLIVNTPVYQYRYKRDAQRSTGDYENVYTGIMAEDIPEVMHHNDEVLDPLSTFGYTVLAIQALQDQIDQLRDSQR